ncbi:MAG TPA: hypothetical protein VKQ30_04805 [Ktedonobacterales bacterium]|nr:hypothetical protein [Ktedonobacterales bacterium]
MGVLSRFSTYLKSLMSSFLDCAEPVVLPGGDEALGHPRRLPRRLPRVASKLPIEQEQSKRRAKAE